MEPTSLLLWTRKESAHRLDSRERERLSTVRLDICHAVLPLDVHIFHSSPVVCTSVTIGKLPPLSHEAFLQISIILSFTPCNISSISFSYSLYPVSYRRLNLNFHAFPFSVPSFFSSTSTSGFHNRDLGFFYKTMVAMTNSLHDL